MKYILIQAFFEGIENLRATGTKAEEVGFRLEFSKTELKKCIKEYPGKEVLSCGHVVWVIFYVLC